jgi:hypothetical protein
MSYRSPERQIVGSPDFSAYCVLPAAYRPLLRAADLMRIMKNDFRTPLVSYHVAPNLHALAL